MQWKLKLSVDTDVYIIEDIKSYCKRASDLISNNTARQKLWNNRVAMQEGMKLLIFQDKRIKNKQHEQDKDF